MPTRVRLIADDLTGAAEVAAEFSRLSGTVTVALTPDASPSRRAAAVLAFDTQTRDATPAMAASTARAFARMVEPQAIVLKKIDSALRGHVGVELREFATQLPERLVVIAPALPHQGRITRAASQYVDAPLALDGAGASPGVRPVADEVPGLRIASVALCAVRGDLLRLVDVFSTATTALVCDAETDEDLTVIAEAGLYSGRDVLWVGSAGLAGALARCLAPDDRRTEAVDVARYDHGRYLAIVGSTAVAAKRQSRSLVDAGATLFELSASTLVDESPDELATVADTIDEAARRGDVVVQVVGDYQSNLSRPVAYRLAALVAKASRAADLVVLTGGATARAVLEECGVGALNVLGSIEAGVVIAATDTEHPKRVITKAGSFGDADVLTRAVGRVMRQ